MLKFFAALFALLVVACGGSDPVEPMPAPIATDVAASHPKHECNVLFYDECYDPFIEHAPVCELRRLCDRKWAEGATWDTCAAGGACPCDGALWTSAYHECVDAAYAECLPVYADCRGE